MSRWNGWFSDLVQAPGNRETVRAFLIFAVLLASLTVLAGRLAFQDLSTMIRVSRVNLAQDEARRIREAVVSLGREDGVINYYKLRRSQKTLSSFLQEWIADRPYLVFVEIRDRFGAPIVSQRRDSAPPLLRSSNPSAGGGSGSSPGMYVAAASLQSGIQPQGEVRVGISDDVMGQELDSLRRSIQLKVAVAALIAILILSAGLVYVLRLVRKIRSLERARGSEERAIHTGILASGLAHEIRNPLNAMNMNLQMLEEELDGVDEVASGDTRDLLTSTKSEIKRLERLVNNFLQYARPQVPRFETKDLNSVLKEIVTFLQADFRKVSVRLETDLEPMLPSVEIDEGQIKQAVMNILVNARQIVPAGGEVVLRSRAGTAGEVIAEIRDTGPGIPPESADKIFEPFFSNRSGGTGLGLPIARQIVQRHGGTIEVEGESGAGTTFRIRLPRRHARSGPGEPPVGTA